MSVDLIISPDAETDIDDAKRWYRSVGLGVDLEFVRALDACIATIVRHPQIHRVVYRSARRALMRRFPYYVIYTICDDTVIVIACFHAKRDPEEWKARV